MTKFWQIAWRSSVAAALAAIAFWAVVHSIGRPTPKRVLFHAVLVPSESRPWMRVPFPFSQQPAWIGEPLVTR